MANSEYERMTKQAAAAWVLTVVVPHEPRLPDWCNADATMERVERLCECFHGLDMDEPLRLIQAVQCILGAMGWANDEEDVWDDLGYRTVTIRAKRAGNADAMYGAAVRASTATRRRYKHHMT